MKRFAVSLFIAGALIIFTAASSIQLQPEHQAYMMFLGLETADDGNIRISALCPKIAGESQSEYQLFQCDGSSVSTAFQTLERSIPRHVVYVQLKALLMTPDFAASEQMNELVYYLQLGAEYYSDAWLMICDHPPSSFLADYRPAIGTRLSSSIQASMVNSLKLNTVPDVHLADLLDGWQGIGGDIPAIACTIENFGENTSIHPEGAWLFSAHQPSLQLNAEETALLNWLRGDMGNIQLTNAGAVVHLSPELPPKVRFDTERGKIVVSGHFVQHQLSGSMLRSQVQYLLEDRLLQLLDKCRAAGSEPFRFSEYAAGTCLTLKQFLDWDFPAFYRNCEFDFHARIRNELT